MTREEAISTVKSNWPDSRYTMLREALETLVPELRESEDERIRKFLVNILSSGTWRKEWPFSPADCVAYLEKQKEQKPVSYSPLCNTIKDKIREYVANHFVTDTVVNTDVKSIVKAMEEGVRLGKEEQKPAEWSEEDKKTLISVICGELELSESRKEYFINLLKSPHPSWKPSEEQMDILDKVYHYLWADRNATADMQDGLGDFIDQLKTL